MINDYKLVYCDNCMTTEQHYQNWTTGDYSLCLGCSKRRQFKLKQEEQIKPLEVILKEYGKYKFKVENIVTDQVSFWCLDVIPGNKAWKVANIKISPGVILFEHRILEVHIEYEPFT